MQKLALSNGAMALDLPCGTGDLSAILLESPPCAKLMPVDLSGPMLDPARRRCRTTAVRANAVALPFPDGLFDGVFVGYVCGDLSRLRMATRGGFCRCSESVVRS